MQRLPQLTVYPDRIAANARHAVEVCVRFGIDVLGVTKSVCGHPDVARAFLEAGIRSLGDARLVNIARLREAGITAPITLIRTPALSEVRRCVELADTSHNTSPVVLEALDRCAAEAGTSHGVILMVDLASGREGVLPEQLPAVARRVTQARALELRGIGVYVSHALDEADTRATQHRLVSLARQIEQGLGLHLTVISGGSTYAFCDTALKGVHERGINQLRIGMLILNGIATSRGPRLVPGFRHDTAVLRAEILETQQRKRTRAICGLGRLDVDPDHLYPVDSRVSIISMSSDHTILDVTGLQPVPRAGACVDFHLGYYGMSRLMLSPSVNVVLARQAPGSAGSA